MNDISPPPLPPQNPRNEESWGVAPWLSLGFGGIMLILLVIVAIFSVIDQRHYSNQVQRDETAMSEAQNSNDADQNSNDADQNSNDADQNSNGADQNGNDADQNGNDADQNGNDADQSDNGPPALPEKEDAQGGVLNGGNMDVDFSNQPDGDRDGFSNDEKFDFGKRVASRGGVSGEIQVTLIWDSRDDLDLSVICPSGEIISYENVASQCGGEMDLDANANERSISSHPVENVYWQASHFPEGDYTVVVENFRSRTSQLNTAFDVRVKNRDRVEYRKGSLQVGEKVKICSFSVK